MSRAQLKKELSNLTAPQLVEVILEAYSAKVEIKEYFEYFLNPDPKKLLEKTIVNLSKEFKKVKHATFKGRVSVINKEVKNFDSHQPGLDYEIKLRKILLNTFKQVTWFHYVADSHLNMIEKLTGSLLGLADRAEQFNSVNEWLLTISKKDSDYVSKEFHNAVSRGIYNYKSINTITKN